MKKKLFAILIALTIVVSSTLFLSEVSFAQGEKYLLSETGGNVLRATDDANDLITYMNDSSHFEEAKSYTLTLNDDLVIPVDTGTGKLKTLEIHSNLTIEGNGNQVTGAEGGKEGDRFIKAKTEKISLNINNLNFDGSEKYAGIFVETEGDTPINLNLYKCDFTKFKVVPEPSYSDISGSGACVLIVNADVDMKYCNFTNSHAYYKGGAIHYYNNVYSLDDRFLDVNLNLYGCNFDGCTAGSGREGGVGGAFSMFATEAYFPMKNDFIFKECSFKNCSAKSGGAIYLGGLGKLVFEDTSIDSCYATGSPAIGDDASGGAIYTICASKIELRSTDKNNIYGITNCKSTGGGGAIYMEDPSFHYDTSDLNIKGLVIENYKIENCEAEGAGAIWLFAVKVDIDNLSIKNCKAKMAGAIYGYVLSGSIKNSEFINNKVDYESEYSVGGAIHIETFGTLGGYPYEKLVIEDTKFEGNKAPRGGAIFFSTKYSGIEIKDGTVFLNNESLQGGAICLIEGIMDIKNAELKNNKALSNEDVKDSGNGAAIYVGPAEDYKNEIKTLNISEDTIITENHADNFGGGIYSNEGKVNIDKATIEKNTALNGGGLYNENSMSSIEKSKIEKNSALNGGGIYINQGLIKLEDSVINENEARFSIVD